MAVSFRFDNVARPAVQNPAAKAAVPSLIYILISGIYIILSGKWAAATAETLEQLKTIEVYKGIAFVVFSGLLFFVITFFLLKSIRQQETTILRQENSLLNAERKEVAAMFAASMAHDLNNLLMSLGGIVETIKEKEEGDEFLVFMREELERSITNLSRLAGHVTGSARQVLLESHQVINLQEMLRRLIALVRKHPDLRSCDIRHEEIPSTAVRLNSFLFEETILNLLVNAGQAAGARGQIEVRVRNLQDTVTVEVHDNGPGIKPEQTEAIFQPCFTTKQDGTGLGLLAVKTFMSSCNGTVKIDRSHLGGALFELRIPKEQAAASEPPSSHADAPPSKAT